MTKFYAAILAAFLVATSAIGASAQEPIKVKDALALITALRNLDGRMIVVEQNGTKGTVMQPWEFKSGLVRLRIAANLTTLANVERAADEARIGIVKQVRKKFSIEKIEADPTAFEEFSRLYDEVLNAPATGAEHLLRIKASDLKLDVNEISVTVLSALSPILDQDVK